MAEATEHPLVSVIIPTYNRADLVARAIESVQKQSYDHLEIIVVDDASSDNTKDVIHGISDRRLRYICHETNRGGAVSRNTGIDAAKGEYIAFLDSDDIWLPQKTERQLTAMQQHPHPGKVVSYTQFQIEQRGKDNILPGRGIGETEPVADYLFANGGEIQTSTVMLPRDLMLATRFRPELKKHQDLDLSIRLQMNGAKFFLIEQMLAVFDNEQRDDRISRISDYTISLKWIEAYEGVISERAVDGFLIKEVLPKLIDRGERKFYAAKIIVNGFRQKIISARRSAALFRRLITPNWLRRMRTHFRNP